MEIMTAPDETAFVLTGARQLLHDESGLTLVELLIVSLVMTILASIAMPSFMAQTGKARDAQAKQVASSAWKAMEACRLESVFGGYENCNANVLRRLEPTLPPNPELKTSSLSATGFAIVVRSGGESSRTFRVKRNAKGILSFPCTAKDKGDCPADGNWAG